MADETEPKNESRYPFGSEVKPKVVRIEPVEGEPGLVNIVVKLGWLELKIRRSIIDVPENGDS